MESEWYESFFTSLALDFWRAVVPAQSTLDEVDFIVRELAVSAPARLLDLPSGTGRHALALAARQYDVTGVDISTDAVLMAQKEAQAQHLKVNFVLGDMRDAPPGAPYDGAYCFGNSFGYLSHDDIRHFVRNVLRAVRPGARWAIDTGAVAESLLPHLTEERTLEAGGVTFSVRSRHDAAARRLFQKCTLARGNQRQTADISYAVYTALEIRQLLESEGWQVLGSYGALDGRQFAPGDRLLLIAQSPGRST